MPQRDQTYVPESRLTRRDEEEKRGGRGGTPEKRVGWLEARGTMTALAAAKFAVDAIDSGPKNLIK